MPDADGRSERQSGPALTLDDILGLAMQANPALRGAQANAAATDGALMQAGALPNPQVSLLQEGFGGLERTTTALVSQVIELGGKRSARLDVASYGKEAALAELGGRAADLQARVTDAFFGLLAARRQFQVANESERIAARFAELAEKRVWAGKASPVDATKAKAAASSAQIELANAKTRVSMAVEKLATLTGSDLVRARDIAGDLQALAPVEPLSGLLARLDDAPLTRMARAEMLRADAAISVERAKRVPDITVSAGMKHVVTGGVSGNQAVVGVSIPLPLFDSNKGAILEATHKAEKAEADFDGEKATLKLALTQAYADYSSAAQEAQRLKNNVLPAAREALDAVSRGYELGKFSFLDVMDAQRTFFQEESRYVQSLNDAQVAHAELGRLVGARLPSGSFPTTERY
ncbi:MAG TPA: TolC family protein [Paraburkholderia sp.]|nr:TolC family protein [Paraburkholderia sp.]